MIPRAYITEWAAAAPWPLELQVEQDLILSRLIVEISNDEVLGPELAFRGGTCLHKLHLPAPLRYSEDLDYVRRTHSGIKAILNALRSVATNCGLVEHATEQRGEMFHITFDGDSLDPGPFHRDRPPDADPHVRCYVGSRRYLGLTRSTFRENACIFAILAMFCKYVDNASNG